ncbi:MAG TPA: hypothetical protein VMH30_00025, partial [Verrucomicrobiae bacterium]|nr:hypothetical protein [Verrucomicrobiae bacterium]
PTKHELVASNDEPPTSNDSIERFHQIRSAHPVCDFFVEHQTNLIVRRVDVTPKSRRLIPTTATSSRLFPSLLLPVSAFVSEFDGMVVQRCSSAGKKSKHF